MHQVNNFVKIQSLYLLNFLLFLFAFISIDLCYPTHILELTVNMSLFNYILYMYIVNVYFIVYTAHDYPEIEFHSMITVYTFDIR
jgi:hypothetical protein